MFSKYDFENRPPGLLWHESDNRLTGPLSQGRQRIVKWKGEKQMNLLKEPLIHMMRSWAAPAVALLLFPRKASCGEGSCVMFQCNYLLTQLLEFRSRTRPT